MVDVQVADERVVGEKVDTECSLLGKRICSELSMGRSWASLSETVVVKFVVRSFSE